MNPYIFILSNYHTILSIFSKKKNYDHVLFLKRIINLNKNKKGQKSRKSKSSVGMIWVVVWRLGPTFCGDRASPMRSSLLYLINFVKLGKYILYICLLCSSKNSSSSSSEPPHHNNPHKHKQQQHSLFLFSFSKPKPHTQQLTQKEQQTHFQKIANLSLEGTQSANTLLRIATNLSLFLGL